MLGVAYCPIWEYPIGTTWLECRGAQATPHQWGLSIPGLVGVSGCRLLPGAIPGRGRGPGAGPKNGSPVPVGRSGTSTLPLLIQYTTQLFHGRSEKVRKKNCPNGCGRQWPRMRSWGRTRLVWRHYSQLTGRGKYLTMPLAWQYCPMCGAELVVVGEAGRESNKSCQTPA